MQGRTGQAQAVHPPASPCDRAIVISILGCIGGVLWGWSLVSAPLVIVTRWRIVMPGFNAIGFDGIPIHFDETDVAIYKTNHVLGIIIVGCSSRFMPGIR